jgi:3-phenylpropionate/cinnamic acid dioxygenase small subunit
MNSELYIEVVNFLNREARLLDDMRFKEWLELVTDDIVYRMPLRVTRERKDGSNLVDEMTFFEETKKSLITRIERIGTSSAWAWDPAPRTRHFISNITIENVRNENELEVSSYFMFMKHRASDRHSEQLFGQRLDVLRKIDGQWKIASRTIYPDQTVLPGMNLSMLL